jgi:hypothetical protein
VASDSALRKIEKAAMVENSSIDYDKRELLSLVHAHLLSSGLRYAPFPGSGFNFIKVQDLTSAALRAEV